MSSGKIILGLSCFYHDSAAALLIDGKIAAAAQEERFTRKKHDESFPKNAIDYCFKSKGLTINDVDYIVFYDKPIAKFERLLLTYIKVWPKGLKSFIMAMRVWLKNKLWIEQIIAKETGFKGEILFTEHHYSHAASAYYCSNFNDAAIVAIDGVGEWDTTTVGYGKGNKICLTHTIEFPDSLGLLYSALTYYLGFKVNSAEYKVMGLAPYGDSSKYYETFKKLIEIKDDGSYKLDMSYFAFEYGLTMTNTKFNRLFDGEPRNSEAPLLQKHKDIAAGLQKLTNEIVVKIVEYAKKNFPSDNLCLAGGVALNCVANGKIIEKGLFKNVYIQPASGDAGGAIGAACYLYYDTLNNPKQKEVLKNIYLGPEYDDRDIEKCIEFISKKLKKQIIYKKFDDQDFFSFVADLINKKYVIGWFQGRMEFGPRALGNRSIIADARDKENWQRVNLKIKFRESFRPFAPSVLEDCAQLWFDLKGHISPYMLLTAQTKKNDLPAVTHIDGSARIQTVSREDNIRYYNLIDSFYKKTGCPVILNTSFNVRGEPIVCAPIDAFNCFINTDMDYLVMNNYIIGKDDNIKLLSLRNMEYLNKFKLD
ncbi:MAG: carbamoyltransferase [bacterium]